MFEELERNEYRRFGESAGPTFRTIFWLLLSLLLVQVGQDTASLGTLGWLLSSDMINVLFHGGLDRSGASVLKRVVHSDGKNCLARRSRVIVFTFGGTEDDVETQEVRYGLRNVSEQSTCTERRLTSRRTASSALE